MEYYKTMYVGIPFHFLLMLTRIRSNNSIDTDFIVYQSSYGFSLQKSLRGFLGDTIPDVPFEVTYAEDMFDADVKAAYSNGEDIAWSRDQRHLSQD